MKQVNYIADAVADNGKYLHCDFEDRESAISWAEKIRSDRKLMVNGEVEIFDCNRGDTIRLLSGERGWECAK